MFILKYPLKKHKGHIKFCLFTNSPKFNINVYKSVPLVYPFLLNWGAFCRVTEKNLKLLHCTGYLPFWIVVMELRRKIGITPFKFRVKMDFSNILVIEWRNDSGAWLVFHFKLLLFHFELSSHAWPQILLAWLHRSQVQWGQSLYFIYNLKPEVDHYIINTLHPRSSQSDT